MLRSLRLRMLAGFAVVIALTLVFASVGAVLLLRDQQKEAAEQRVGLLVAPFATRVQTMEVAGWPLTRIRSEMVGLARYYGVRVLLLDSRGRVIADTDDDEGMLETILIADAVSSSALDTSDEMQSFRSWRVDDGGVDLFVFAATDPRPMVPSGSRASVEGSQLVVVVPASDITNVWAALLPRLAPAGALAALAGVLVATVLASRITRPIAQMTVASRAMARGQYDQRIEVSGEDEVAQLSRAFNEMSGEVERSHTAMRQLLANVSHDLKTPLTSIHGYSQAMVDGLAEQPDDYRDMARVILDESERMGALVEDLLYLSRIESGELVLQLDEVDLDAVLAATANRLRFQTEAADVTVRLVLHGAPLRADSRRLEQLCANLLDNAIRFSNAGGEVVIESSMAERAAVFTVHNTGAVIAPEQLPHVFDRFYQGDPSRGGPHSGLGLAIVQELVHAHGGEVTVRSTEDAGTTFTVRLPHNGGATVA